MGGACRTNEWRNAYRLFVGKLEKHATLAIYVIVCREDRYT
jgi:hypothetical protein